MNIEEAAKAALLEEAVPGLFYVSEDGLERFAKIIRNQALEDAAAQCGSVYHNYIGPEYGPVRYGVAECAYVIRAMKEQT